MSKKSKTTIAAPKPRRVRFDMNITDISAGQQLVWNWRGGIDVVVQAKQRDGMVIVRYTADKRTASATVHPNSLRLPNAPISAAQLLAGRTDQEEAAA